MNKLKNYFKNHGEEYTRYYSNGARAYCWWRATCSQVIVLAMPESLLAAR